MTTPEQPSVVTYGLDSGSTYYTLNVQPSGLIVASNPSSTPPPSTPTPPAPADPDAYWQVLPPVRMEPAPYDPDQPPDDRRYVLHLATDDGLTIADVKWDGCIHLNEYYVDHTTGKPDFNDGNYWHICDIDDEIARLQELRALAIAHFDDDSYWYDLRTEEQPND